MDTAPKNVIPVLIFCHARAQYLQRTLDSVFNALTSEWNDRFIVFISQDGDDFAVQQIIQKYAAKQRVFWLEFDYNSTPKRMMKGFEDERAWRTYHKISAHYKWALNKLLFELNYDKIVILEEDMLISPDFFSYFYHLAPLLDADDSVYCISAWNDFGQKGLVKNEYSLYRSDVFPGLGWMLTQNLWNELHSNFSLAFWDDWFREPKQAKNRSCIRPEMSRTHTFGQIGASGGFFYAQYLEKMQLNQKNIDWSKENVDYLLDGQYDEWLKNMISSAVKINEKDLKKERMREIEKGRDCVLYYGDLNHFTKVSRRLHLMNDHKFGMPRTSYRGIVIVHWMQHRVIFVPKNVDWSRRT